jgi:hypothetical protein
MGIFDRFRKDKSNKNDNSPKDENHNSSEESPHFTALSKYREYIVLFISMQAKGNYSPIAAFENPEGELTGFLYLVDDPGVGLSVEDSIARMEEEFAKRMSEGNLESYAIFYHSQFDGKANHTPAAEEEQLKAISIKYKSGEDQAQFFAVPYQLSGESLTYQSIAGLHGHENDLIFSTKLEEGKDYFQERIAIEPEIVENEHGIKIQKVNRGALENTWCGIFGFEHFREGGGGDFLMQVFALVIMKKEFREIGNLQVYEEKYGEVIYRALKKDGNAVTICPVIGPGEVIPVTIKKVQEWAHIEGHEAVIASSGRDTFGLWFFATDYAENKHQYLSKKNLDIELSGIAYVLDISKINERESKSEWKFSDDFTSYMPNKEHAYLGCFDFIGVVLEMQEVGYSPREEDKGYLLKIRLITNADDPNFFNLPIFVNRTNMRIEKIEIGLKVTGMFQLQGQIRQ